MKINYPHKAASLVICALATTAARGADQVTFHVISYTKQHAAPVGIVEGSPGVFYFEATSSPAALSSTAQGTETVLATFPSGNQIGGPPVSGADGRLYDSVEVSIIAANVFSVSPAPGAQVYQAQNVVPFLTGNLPDGTLFGTAVAAGDSPWYVVNVNLQGSVSPVYQFPSGERALTVTYATDGNYYGLAEDGPGYLFRLTPSGVLTKLVDFHSGSLLPSSYTPLIQASDGNLYGVTNYGGANGVGTIYRITLGGQYTLLYTFPKNQNSAPAALIEGSDSNLYGATLGHVSGSGHSQLFRITTGGQYTLIYDMKNISADGLCPCSMVQGSDGNIYGTALSGGPYNDGVIFALEMGLPKPAPRVLHVHPEAGIVGTVVHIWGSNLLNASVQFNGVAATDAANSGPIM